MGAFYGSVQVRGDDRDAIRPAVEGLSRETGRKFLLGPSLDGWIGIYPDDCGQDLGLAGDLARRLPGEVFAVRVHDDDFFAYEYYRGGELVDAYDSALGNGDEAFGEEPLEPNSRPEAFAHLVSDQAGFVSLNQRLLTQGTQRDLLATELLEAFAEALGIRNAITSYDYLLENNQTDDIEGWDEFVHIPKLPLVSGESLIAEWSTPDSPITPGPCLCPAPDGQGFLVVASRLANAEQQPRPLERYGLPWASAPTLAPWAVDAHVDSLALSDSGRYLSVASTSTAGISRVALWDTRENRLVAKTPKTDSAHWLGFAAGDLAMVSVSSDRVGEQEQLPPVDRMGFRFISLSDVKLAAVHPSGASLVVIDSLHRFLVVDVTTGRVAHQMAATFAAEAARRYLEAPGMEAAIRAEMSVTRKIMKKTGLPAGSNSVKEFMEQFERDYRAQLVHMMVDAATNSSPTGGIFCMRFDSSGERLCLGTMTGLCVYLWEEIASSHGVLPDPIAGVDPAEIPGTRGAYIYDIAFDPARGRILFAGESGRVHFIEFPSRRSEVLLEPACLRPIHRVALSQDRSTLSLIRSGEVAPNREASGPALQCWDYQAVSKT